MNFVCVFSVLFLHDYWLCVASTGVLLYGAHIWNRRKNAINSSLSNAVRWVSVFTFSWHFNVILKCSLKIFAPFGFWNNCEWNRMPEKVEREIRKNRIGIETVMMIGIERKKWIVPPSNSSHISLPFVL